MVSIVQILRTDIELSYSAEIFLDAEHELVQLMQGKESRAQMKTHMKNGNKHRPSIDDDGVTVLRSL